MTNEQLVRQYYDGDDAALEKLYNRCKSTQKGAELYEIFI